MQGEVVSVSGLLGRRRHDRVVLREQRDARPARLTLPLLGQGPPHLYTPASSARLADSEPSRAGFAHFRRVLSGGLRCRVIRRRRARRSARGHANLAIGAARGGLL